MFTGLTGHKCLTVVTKLDCQWCHYLIDNHWFSGVHHNLCTDHVCEFQPISAGIKTVYIIKSKLIYTQATIHVEATVPSQNVCRIPINSCSRLHLLNFSHIVTLYSILRAHASRLCCIKVYKQIKAILTLHVPNI